MKKIAAVLAAIVFLCCACEASNEKEYIAQLEERITSLEQQIKDLKAGEAEKPPQASPSLAPVADVKESPVQSSEALQASNSADAGNTQDAAASLQSSGDAGTTVYITKTGKKYHKKGCSLLSKSCIAILLDEAAKKGYTPCGRCNPP